MSVSKEAGGAGAHVEDDELVGLVAPLLDRLGLRAAPPSLPRSATEKATDKATPQQRLSTAAGGAAVGAAAAAGAGARGQGAGDLSGRAGKPVEQPALRER